MLLPLTSEELPQRRSRRISCPDAQKGHCLPGDVTCGKLNLNLQFLVTKQLPTMSGDLQLLVRRDKIPAIRLIMFEIRSNATARVGERCREIGSGAEPHFICIARLWSDALKSSTVSSTHETRRGVNVPSRKSRPHPGSAMELDATAGGRAAMPRNEGPGWLSGNRSMAWSYMNSLALTHSVFSNSCLPLAVGRRHRLARRRGTVRPRLP
jgi:hypothetical protein